MKQKTNINLLKIPKLFNDKVNPIILFQKALHLGKPRSFTHLKLMKYIIGTYETTEILNLIYSRQFLIWQVSPIIKYACHIQLAYPALFLLASSDSNLAGSIKRVAMSFGIDYKVNGWLAGSLTAQIQLKRSPDFVIVPDCGRSAMIVNESMLASIPTIGLVNSNNKIASQVTHPIFGNDENLYTSEFFCQLCASLILKEQWWKNNYFLKSQSIRNFRHKLNLKMVKKMASKYFGPARFKKKWYSKKPSWFKHHIYFDLYKRFWLTMHYGQRIWKLKNFFSANFNSEWRDYWKELFKFKGIKFTKNISDTLRKLQKEAFGRKLFEKNIFVAANKIAKDKKRKVWMKFSIPPVQIGFKLFRYFNWRYRPQVIQQSKIYLFENDFKEIYENIKKLENKKLIALAKDKDYFAKKFLNIKKTQSLKKKRKYLSKLMKKL